MTTLPRVECVTAEQLAVELDTGSAQLVDVREAIEYGSEHIDGARHIPLGELERRLGEIPRDGTVTVICRSGIRATQAAESLLAKGRSVRVLEGGMLAWMAAGLPAVTGRRRLAIDRQVQLIVGSAILLATLAGVASHPGFLIVPILFGAGLAFAGATGTCPLANLLALAPWNQVGNPPVGAPGSCGAAPEQPSPADKGSTGCCGGH